MLHQEIDADVLALLESVGAPGEHGPHEEIDGHLLGPDGGRPEEIAADHLVEEHESHEEDAETADVPEDQVSLFHCVSKDFEHEKCPFARI